MLVCPQACYSVYVEVIMRIKDLFKSRLNDDHTEMTDERER
jgi:hypothetical protein